MVSKELGNFSLRQYGCFTTTKLNVVKGVEWMIVHFLAGWSEPTFVAAHCTIVCCCVCEQSPECDGTGTAEREHSASVQCCHECRSGESEEGVNKYRAVWSGSCQARHSWWCVQCLRQCWCVYLYGASSIKPSSLTLLWCVQSARTMQTQMF